MFSMHKKRAPIKQFDFASPENAVKRRHFHAAFPLFTMWRTTLRTVKARREIAGISAFSDEA